MLSQLLDIVDEGKDGDKLDRLLDQLNDLFFALTPYFDAPKASPKQTLSTSLSNSASSSPPPESSKKKKEFTNSELALCGKIAQFTGMHETHILDFMNEFDAISISETDLWHYVYAERQRMFNCMIAMLDFVITNECPNSQIANSITNHIENWIANGWKSKILACYDKLTNIVIPDQLPMHFRPQYCQYIATEQLLLWKMVFLLFSEPIIAELDDLDFYFGLYDMSHRRKIQKYLQKTHLNFSSADAHNCLFKIHQILKKKDDLIIAVFMELLPIADEHGYVDHFEAVIENKESPKEFNPKLAHPKNLSKMRQKLDIAMKQKEQNNNHIRNIFKLYSDVCFTLIDLMKIAKQNGANINMDDIEQKQSEVAMASDAVTPSNLINCFEKILITFDDCDDSDKYMKPMQVLIKSYLDAILLRDVDILLSADNIHYIYQWILCQNDGLCNDLLSSQGPLRQIRLRQIHFNALDESQIWKYSKDSFQTQPHLLLGLMASLCSNKQCAQSVYNKFSENSEYFMTLAQIEEYVEMNGDDDDMVTAKETFEWNHIIIRRGTKGQMVKGRDNMTEMVKWNVSWNGFLWILALLNHCIHDQYKQSEQKRDINQSFAVNKHSMSYLSHHTLPSAMRLFTNLSVWYPKCIQFMYEDMRLIVNKQYNAKSFVRSHPRNVYKSILNMGGIQIMSVQLFTHSMQRLREYAFDYESHQMSNALSSTKDNYDSNLDLFKDVTQFLKFFSVTDIECMMKIIFNLDNNEKGFFSKMILTAIQTLAQCIQNTQKQHLENDDLAFEKAQYQLKCVWNIIGYLIKIVHNLYNHADIFYFVTWQIDIVSYVNTLLSIFPLFYPMTSFNVNENDIDTLHSHCIELHSKAINLVYSVVKSTNDFGIVMNKFINDSDDGFRNFIVDPIIYSTEILNFIRSHIRHSDERIVVHIICTSLKTLQCILDKLSLNQRQEIVAKLGHKLNPNRDQFERVSFADKLCELIRQNQKKSNLCLIKESCAFLKFLCNAFPANSEYPYYKLFNSMTQIQRLSAYICKYIKRYLHVKEWKNGANEFKIEYAANDIRYAHMFVDLLCVFMSNQDRLRHLLLRDEARKLLKLLMQIVTHKDAFSDFPSVLSKGLEIVWLLHSDLDTAISESMDDVFWTAMSDVLSSEFVMIPVLHSPKLNAKQNGKYAKMVEGGYVIRCWQNECYSWCFSIILQEIEQTLSFFDDIDSKYALRRKNVNKMMSALAIDQKLLSKWMEIMMNVPGICVDLLKKRSDIFIDYQLQIEEFKSQQTKNYGRKFMDNHSKLINKLRLLSTSAKIAQMEQTNKNKQQSMRRRQQQQQSGHKRHYDDVANDLMTVPKLKNVKYCTEVIDQYNLMKSLIFSHRLMLCAWSELLQHVCLCSPHILGLLPIACYNQKLSQTHLDTTVNKIKSMTNLSTNKGGLIYSSPSKRTINREESIKQLFHWQILRSLPRPKRQSKLISSFVQKLAKSLNTAFKFMMDPQYWHKNNDDEKEEINLEGMQSFDELEQHLSAYIAICRVLHDVITHLTQDCEDENNENNVLSFDVAKKIFVNIAECIQISSQFSTNQTAKTYQPSPKRTKMVPPMKSIDDILHLLLMCSMLTLKWMLLNGPSIDIEADNQMNTSFVSSMHSKRPQFAKWTSSKDTTTPIKKRLFADYDDSKNEENDNSDDEVLADMNMSNMSTSQGLSRSNAWFDAIRGSLIILKVLSSTSNHLIIDKHPSNVIAVSIFPYLIECIPFSDLSLESIKEYDFVKHCMSQFGTISNSVVDAFIAKEREFDKMEKECKRIKHKAFVTKDDKQRVIEVANIKMVMEKEYIINSFIPSIERLSSILQCFVSIAQKSLVGAILLFENELLLYLTNCAIFKSQHAQFCDPYLIDNGEENPCHELWCKSLELITYLLNQCCLALNSETNEMQSKVISEFITNIMQFCSVHHDKICQKIKYIANSNSYLRLRDLEEINIIASFIYEIEKNAILIAQQSLDTKTEFSLHNERFEALLQIIIKFVILLESPEMLDRLTPPISTHEKYAFGHLHSSQQQSQQQQMQSSQSQKDQIEKAKKLQLERQQSKHIQWASDVMGGNSFEQNEDDNTEQNEENNENVRSPLPLGKLLRRRRESSITSVGTSVGMVEDDDASLRRDQFLQRIEYYILNVLKSILFCCRYEIMDNWNHKHVATHLFAVDLRQKHFLSEESGSVKPSLSVLFRLSHYAITHLKGLYQTQLNEEREAQMNGGGDDGNDGGGILRMHGFKQKKKKKKSDNKGQGQRDCMYDSKKVESEGLYHVVTRKNIEKTLWILFEHCYIDLLLQIDCFLKKDERLIVENINSYTQNLDKLWKRIDRFDDFLNNHSICGYSQKEMKFILILRNKQHHQLSYELDMLRNKWMPNVKMLTDQSQFQSETMTGSRQYQSPAFEFNSRMNSSFNTPRSRQFKASSHASSSWA